MTYGYAEIITIELVMICIPAVVLTVVTRPKPFYNVFRGGEAALCLAFAIDAARRLLLIGGGTPITFPPDTPLPFSVSSIPGEWIALVNICLLTICWALLWGRVSQNIRHKVRNKETEKRFVRDLAVRE